MKNELYLLNYLKTKSEFYDPILSQADNIRGMMNEITPYDLSDEFYFKQDEFLQDRLSKLNVIDVNNLEFKDNIALYKGDITLLQADAIVNAGNAALLGCFIPLHSCIDNCIHSYAGLEVRRDIMDILKGREVDNGEVIVTKGYNLPAKYIFHTVGPIYEGIKRNDIDLALCYLNSLEQADKMGLKNIVFCSISTGVYGFPINRASDIAINTVRNYLKEHHSSLKVVFDLFSKFDYEIYERKLNKD